MGDGTMSLYERYILPPMLDFAMRQKPIMLQRRKVVPLAKGKVLEIGVGSGLNLPLYDPEQVSSVTGLDPSLELQVMAKQRAKDCGLPIDFLSAGAEEIPAVAESFDCVVMTYTLCTIPEGERALKEIHRVLKPGGSVLFTEHGLAPDPDVVRWQNRINPWWKRLAGGCNLNRPVSAMLQTAGFDLQGIETMYLPGPRPMTFNTWGQAHR
jgi:ubiquinone/menaquinone biosynthesis C-methylase UbiE